MSWLSYSSLIPPNLFILLTILGVIIAWRWTRLGLVVATVGAAFLYLAATPVVADWLLRSVEALAAATPTLPSEMPPGAIEAGNLDGKSQGHTLALAPVLHGQLAQFRPVGEILHFFAPRHGTPVRANSLPNPAATAH